MIPPGCTISLEGSSVAERRAVTAFDVGSNPTPPAIHARRAGKLTHPADTRAIRGAVPRARTTSLGSSQAGRQRALNPSCAGANPASPAIVSVTPRGRETGCNPVAAGSTPDADSTLYGRSVVVTRLLREQDHAGSIPVARTIVDAPTARTLRFERGRLGSTPRASSTDSGCSSVSRARARGARGRRGRTGQPDHFAAERSMVIADLARVG